MSSLLSSSSFWLFYIISVYPHVDHFLSYSLPLLSQCFHLGSGSLLRVCWWQIQFLFSESLFILYTFLKVVAGYRSLCLYQQLFFSKHIKDHSIVSTEKSATRHKYYFFEGNISLSVFKIICFCYFTTSP